MELVHEWLNALHDGGWAGLLMGGFLIVAIMFVLSFITNKYFWLIVFVAAAVYTAYYYAL